MFDSSRTTFAPIAKNKRLRFAHYCQTIHSFSPPQPYLVRIWRLQAGDLERGACNGGLGELEDVMRHCANPLVPTVIVGSLAAAAAFGTAGMASAADDCLEKPNLQFDQPGHWYYRVDRVEHRRCWYFLPSEATIGSLPPSNPAPVANADSQPSWFSRFSTAWEQTFPPQPQHNSAPEDPSGATKTTSPAPAKSNKMTRRERPPTVPSPETNGAASGDRQNPLPSQSIAEKNQQQVPTRNPGDNGALFEEFLKWYVDRSIFGHP